MCVCVINAYQHFLLQMGSPDSSICAKFNVDCTDAYAQGFTWDFAGRGTQKSILCSRPGVPGGCNTALDDDDYY